MKITASKLYNYTQCPHRIWRDLYGPQDEKSKEINPFVQLLWDKGLSHEERIVSGIGEFLDFSKGSSEDRFRETIKAMNTGVPLIYQGVLIKDNLFGIPDLLKRMPDKTYVPIDIKSGAGREGVNENLGKKGKLKKHYAVQLALYADVLNRLGFTNKKIAIVIDVKGDEIVYDLESVLGQRQKETYWDLYEKIKGEVLLLLQNKIQNKPAISGVCKFCPWYKSCKKWIEDTDDLTGLFYVGRNKRDILNKDIQVEKIRDMLTIDTEHIMDKKSKDKSFLSGIGAKTIEKIVARANVLRKIKKPVIYQKINFPEVSYELFFDIEGDPTQDFIYLHGVYERGPKGERFLSFVADEISPDVEKRAWSKFWKYINSLPKDDFAIYYYASYEKNVYRRMQKLYPDVVSEESLEKFFNNKNVIDLYNIILKNTDWPVGSYSLKSIAMNLGFKWRDEDPSGASSIQWFNEYIKTNDKNILKRILLYNEDDCRATMVVKDKIKRLSDKLFI